MRIAVDLRPLLTKHTSGVTVFTRSMIRALKQLPDVELYLFYQAGSKFQKLHDEFKGVHFIQKSNSVFHMTSLLKMRKLPRNYFKTPVDLVFLPDRRPFYRTKMPVVLTIHDFVPEKFPHTLSFKGRLWAKLFSTRRLIKHSSGVITPSETVGRNVPLDKPVCVIYEGTNATNKVSHPELSKRVQDFYFFLSPLDPRKRYEWFIQLAKDFPKETFVWAGLKENDKRFKKAKLSIPKNLHILGEVSESEKHWLFENSKAFLSLSEYEGFDLPLLEAFSFRTPIILSRISVHNELYKSKECFIENYETLYRKIISLNSKNRNQVREMLKIELRKKMSWELSAKKALLFFRRIVVNKDR